jgi:hypothetical protein
MLRQLEWGWLPEVPEVRIRPDITQPGGAERIQRSRDLLLSGLLFGESSSIERPGLSRRL